MSQRSHVKKKNDTLWIKQGSYSGLKFCGPEKTPLNDDELLPPDMAGPGTQESLIWSP
jgi:hypothetical protein